MRTSVNSIAGSVAVLEPVELPGSTPEDLPDPDNLDLYSLPSKPQTTVRQAATLPPTIDTVNLENVTESDTSPKTPKHADTVPLLGRRYRARRVLVPAAPPGKHRSLPVQLPYIPQTPSLASDLSGWMSEPENEHTTAMMESPVSDASSPKAPSAAVPLAHRATSFESVTTSTSIATISNAEASDHAASSKLEQTSTSMSQESSLEPSLGRSSIESSISMTSPKAYKSPHVDASNHYIQKETHSDVVSQNHLVELPTEREAPPEQPLSAPAQPKTQNQPDTQALPVQSKPVPAMPVTPASVQALGTPGQDQPEPNENQPKPMTSQAKRRAAHARRMRVAYG